MLQTKRKCLSWTSYRTKAKRNYITFLPNYFKLKLREQSQTYTNDLLIFTKEDLSSMIKVVSPLHEKNANGIERV